MLWAVAPVVAPSVAVPESDAARYRSAVGRDLVFGLRPEHITEPRRAERNPACEFAVALDIVEAMGMETMIYFTVDGQEVCGRVDPEHAAAPGATMRLYANMEHMHLIDPQTNAVI